MLKPWRKEGGLAHPRARALTKQRQTTAGGFLEAPWPLILTQFGPIQPPSLSPNISPRLPPPPPGEPTSGKVYVNYRSRRAEIANAMQPSMPCGDTWDVKTAKVPLVSGRLKAGCCSVWCWLAAWLAGWLVGWLVGWWVQACPEKGRVIYVVVFLVCFFSFRV